MYNIFLATIIYVYTYNSLPRTKVTQFKRGEINQRVFSDKIDTGIGLYKFLSKPMNHVYYNLTYSM